MSTRPDDVRSEAAVAHFDTGFGIGAVLVGGGRLLGVDLPSPGYEIPPATGADRLGAEDRAALARWVSELEAYFRGERLTWTADEMGLDRLDVPPFDRKVFATLLEVPPGETVGYGELAERAGFPRAARAVGNAMAGNPIPIVVPCHRVVHADGRLGRYGNDAAWKPRLLAHEEKHASRATGGQRTG